MHGDGGRSVAGWGKRVLVVEDGPTLTHGEMPYGAGVVAANRFGATKLVDPRPFAVGSIQKTFEKFQHLGKVLPAMGYSEVQRHELEEPEITYLLERFTDEYRPPLVAAGR